MPNNAKHSKKICADYNANLDFVPTSLSISQSFSENCVRLVVRRLLVGVYNNAELRLVQGEYTDFWV